MKFVTRLRQDYVYRTVVAAAVAFAINIAFALYNGVYGIMFSSAWFATLCVYYILLALLRGAVVLRTVKNRNNQDGEISGLKIYRFSGILLLTLTIALTGAVILMVADGKTFEHAGLMIYAAASYTFYKITASVVNFVRTRKVENYSVKALRYIGFADALVSMLALQTALISAFSVEGEDLSVMNAVTGVVVCAVVIALGLYMIINSTIKLKNKRFENEEL